MSKVQMCGISEMLGRKTVNWKCTTDNYVIFYIIVPTKSGWVIAHSVLRLWTDIKKIKNPS